MTPSVDSEATNRRSRRALLGGVLGGIGAWAVSAAGRASPVRGAGDDGATVVVGGGYADARTQTTIANQANNSNVLWVASNADLGNGGGVAITGFSANNVGVHGLSTSNIGVRGQSDSSAGLFGRSTTDRGVYAESQSGEAIYATSQFSIGIIGNGLGPSGMGVWGQAGAGRGVFGSATSGVALDGEAGSGLALRTSGRIKLAKVSGVATIPAGSTSVTVNPEVNVGAESFVLLTPKTNVGGRGLWFTTNTTADTFTIRMSSKRSSATRVAWLLLG